MEELLYQESYQGIEDGCRLLEEDRLQVVLSFLTLHLILWYQVKQVYKKKGDDIV